MRETLYAPWRDDYVKSRTSPDQCVFCAVSESSDQDLDNGVLYRDNICFIIMNRYPYTPGHFMIIPHQHTDRLEELPVDDWLHINRLSHIGVSILKRVTGATGVNIGMNLGKSAGAGIAEHIHLHLVPRYERDTNFITTVAETRVYSTDFHKIFTELITEWKNISIF